MKCKETLRKRKVQLVPTTIKRRFFNWVLDGLAYYFFLVIISLSTEEISSNGTLNDYINDDLSFFLNIVYVFAYGIFMGIYEHLMKGETIGKKITRTRAVLSNGQPLTLKAAMLRGLTRCIPLEQLSALNFQSYLLHDRLSDTYVVDMRKSVLPKS